MRSAARQNMAGSNVDIEWLKGLGVGTEFGGPSLSTVPENAAGTSQFEPMDRANLTSATLKRNTKLELSKNDLLKLVTCFEGELQARDIAIAALKSEKVKQVANLGRYRPAVLSDPYTALLRDTIADTPNSKPPLTEKDMAAAAEHQQQALEQLSMRLKWAHQHMMNILKEAEIKHKKVIQELEEEKCKHEHDTAQGDDITYGLEMERTRLKQELETERNTRKKLDKEVKRQIELADEERARQKEIVLLLLAERKKIIVKYIEERKRSEDLAQILAEEKARIDTMAEGLEEESKKSLQMEADLEKQAHDFDIERKNIKSQMTVKDQKITELETEVNKLRMECESLRNRLQLGDSSSAMSSSVAKVVQPTATVSSVPVSGPSNNTNMKPLTLQKSVRGRPYLLQTGNRAYNMRTKYISVANKNSSQVAHNSISIDSSSGREMPSNDDWELPLGGPTGIAQSVIPGQTLKQTAPVHSPPRGIPFVPAGTSTMKPKYNSVPVQPQSTPPQMPPKKGSVAARGVPPPIPPNKPVIPTKNVPPRRPESGGDIDKKKNQVSVADS